MSSKENRRSSVENQIPTKRTCMDAHYHDDSSLSTFSWYERSDGSSTWHVVYETGKSNNKTMNEVENAPFSCFKSSESQQMFTRKNTSNDDSTCTTLTPVPSLNSESSYSCTTPSGSSGSITPKNDHSLSSDLFLSDSVSSSDNCKRNDSDSETPKYKKLKKDSSEKIKARNTSRTEKEISNKVDSIDKERKYRSCKGTRASKEKTVKCTGISPLHISKTADREAFVMKIMKTFKSNSLYDSFCYTLPRSRKAVVSFHAVMNNILSLADQCRFGLIRCHHEDFPSNDSHEFAEGIVQDMRKRYTKVLESMTDGGNPSEIDESLSDMLEKEVDNDLPSSLVFYISDAFTDIVPSWCGQFQVCINPVTDVISVRMFEYKPSYPGYMLPAFSSKLITEEMCAGICKQMEYFECSRQFRMDIDLHGINSLTYFQLSNQEGLLFLKICTTVKFYQRFVNCSASKRNDWSRRDSFLPFMDGSNRSDVLVLGGHVSEMSNIAAQIVSACPGVQFLDTTVSDIVNSTPKHKQNDTNKEPRNTNNPMCKTTRSVRVSLERRTQLIDILNKHKLIPEDQCTEITRSFLVQETCFDKGHECNFLNIDKWQPCFSDYVNHRCLNASELEHRLTRRTAIASSDPDTQVSVAQYLTTNGSMPYYSFCTADIANKGMWHCSICGICNNENEWHCPECNKCSKRQTICEYCGYSECGYIIEPRSVMEEVPSKCISNWHVSLCKSDVPNWSTDVMNVKESVSFDIQDFKRDELGLIDPMAFLLGSEARGGGNRQGRCRQKYEKKIEGNPKMLAAAGCIIQ